MDDELFKVFVTIGLKDDQAVADRIKQMEADLAAFAAKDVELKLAPEVDLGAFTSVNREAKLLAEAIREVDEQLAKVDDSEIRRLAAGFSDAAIGVKGVKTTERQFNDLGASTSRVNNLLFDTVALADDLQYGFRGAANNVPQVARSFQLLTAQAGGFNQAFAAIRAVIGRTVAAIPGLTAALVALGSGAAIAGLAAAVGRFDELKTAVGNVVETIGDGIGALGGVIGNVLSPIGNAIRDNLIDPFISAVNVINSDVRSALGFEVDISGFDSFQAAEKALNEFNEEMTFGQKEAQALQADIDSLRQGIADGTNDTALARQQISLLSEEFNKLTTASARKEIEDYVQAIKDMEKPKIEVELEETFRQLDRLKQLIEEGGREATGAEFQIKPITEGLFDAGIAEMNKAMRLFDSNIADLSEREFEKIVEEANESAQAIEIIATKIGSGQLGSEFERLKGSIAAFSGEYTKFKEIEEATKKAEQEAGRMQKRIDSLIASTRDWKDEARAVRDEITAALKNTDVELSFDAGLNAFQVKLSRILEKEFGKIEDFQLSTGRLAAGQVGSQEERDALFAIQDVNEKAIALQEKQDERARRREEIMNNQTDILKNIHSAIKANAENNGRSSGGVNVVEYSGSVG